MKTSSKVKVLALGATVTALSFVGVKGLSELFFSKLIKRKVDPYVREEIEDEKSSVISEARAWFSSMESEEVKLQTFDDVILHSTLLKQKASNKWVIIAHGYSANYKEELDVAKNFYDQGFNLMMVNLRGHGLSSGKYIGFGWPDRLDIISCIHYLTALNPDIQIVLYGLSMGASTMMNVTGEVLPQQVVCLVEDSGYSSMEELMKSMFKKVIPFMPIPAHYALIHGVNRLIKKRCGYSVFENSCVEQLKKSKIPTLFIHSEDDEIVPFSMVFDNYYACSAIKELYTIPEATHGLGNMKPQYYDRVFKFVNRFIK